MVVENEWEGNDGKMRDGSFWNKDIRRGNQNGDVVDDRDSGLYSVDGDGRNIGDYGRGVDGSIKVWVDMIDDMEVMC